MSGDNKFTVYVAIVAAIPGVLASIPALLNSSESTENLKLLREIASDQKVAQEIIDIRQAKLDERDLIISEGGKAIPLSHNSAWDDYYTYTTKQGLSRKEASEKVANKAKDFPEEAVRKPL